MMCRSCVYSSATVLQISLACNIQAKHIPPTKRILGLSKYDWPIHWYVECQIISALQQSVTLLRHVEAGGSVKV